MQVLPNVKRLIGDQGVTFDNNFDSFSLCCPSRATFLTGQYSHNNGVRGNAPPQGGYQALDKSNTLLGLAPARRLLHRAPRQVPQRLRPPEPDGDPGRLERVARGGRSDHLPLLQLHAQRGRNAAHLLRDTATVVLPDRRLPGQGERDHPAPRRTGALLPVGGVPRRPFRRAARARRSAAARHTGPGSAASRRC